LFTLPLFDRGRDRARHDSATGCLGVVVRRSEFDASLFARAAADGVAAFDGEGVVAIARVSGGFRVTTDARAVTSAYVAACDGAGSTVRKLLGVGEPARRGHLFVLETPVADGDQGPRAGLCDFELAPSGSGLDGYYWDFPTVMGGRAAVSRGIYHANLAPRRDVKAILARALAARGFSLADLAPRPFATRPFAPSAPLALGRLALVGEAAGIDAVTGEGIAQAIVFGRIAARHIAFAVRTGAPELTGYTPHVRASRMGRHLAACAWLAPRVYGPHGARWQRFLASSPAACEAGAKWYKGESLPLATKASLAVRLATSWI
jgi:flavin-dependent dehydrogenase